MSEIFEGVLVCGTESEVRHAFAGIRSIMPLGFAHITEGLWGVYAKLGRNAPLNRPEDEKVASHFSSVLGKALLVLYDNRCEIDLASLFVDGKLAREFNESDQVWVLLDEYGEPLIHGERFHREELQDDREYDCVQSAIEAGLAGFGIAPSVDLTTLKQAFCYHFEN